MHVLAPKPTHPEFQMFFNVDQSVGHNAANANPDDILLVQFLLKQLGERQPSATAAGRARRERMRNVPLTGHCCPLTIDGIRAAQESGRDVQGPSSIVDGRVSSARGYNYGGGFWTIVDLNYQFRHITANMWPRLQDVPGCPGALAQKVRAIL